MRSIANSGPAMVYLASSGAPGGTHSETRSQNNSETLPFTHTERSERYWTAQSSVQPSPTLGQVQDFAVAV